jgi:hypothetical protein
LPAIESKLTSDILKDEIFIQDIDAYSARDTGKTRDMEVGMLPPKLAQMMLSLALGNGT